jgi:anti-anti-sigma factor
MTDILRLQITPGHGDDVVVTLTGELDLSSRDELAAVAFDLLDNAKNVVIDLSGVTFLDSAAMSTLVKVRLEADRRGAEVRLRGAKGSVAEVLAITGLDRWLSD